MGGNLRTVDYFIGGLRRISMLLEVIVGSANGLVDGIFFVGDLYAVAVVSH